MEFVKKTLKELCSLMTVSGFEKKSREQLYTLVSPLFDKVEEDSFGNLVCVKKGGRDNSPRLMIDAHLDTVGMMVTDILEGGFLSVVSIGGLDTRILPSAEVTVYGKERVYGIISSIPPHLRKSRDSSVPTMEELYIDTGYSKDALKEIVSVGDPVVIEGRYTELQNGYICSASLDDKACACGVLDAVSRMDKDTLKYDVYVTLSAQEETGKCGAALCACRIKPDMAIVTDVNFGTLEDDDLDSIKCGEGAAIDISAATDRRLTRGIMALLDKSDIPYQRVCEPTRTGTNSELVSVTGEGVPTVLMSVPLKSMHTPVEAVCLSDIKSLSDIILKVVTTEADAL